MLSILICTHPGREESFNKLVDELNRQIADVANYIEIIHDDDPTKSIGKKRNDLLSKVQTQYFCFIDSDDMVSRDYIKKIHDALIANYPDCCTLTGVITWDGENPELFEHSIKYLEYRTNEVTAPIRYERYPNHLNVIKTEIGRQFKFPEINHGEDTDFATQMFKSGLLKTEVEIPGVIYHYQFKTKK